MIETLTSSTRNLLHQAETSNDSLIRRSVFSVTPEQPELASALEERRLKVYLGIDPTSPELHIGHSIPLRKISEFQRLGHEVVLLFGTFTGMIGDPTDKSTARVKLTREQVAKNVATYSEQASKILDLSPTAPNPVGIVYNDQWLGELTFADIVDLAANFSVQQLEKRDMFQKRRADDKPIWLHEFLYPMMQAQDAVHLGVDVEVGGSDQLFNMIMGRDLVKRYLNKEKWCLATKLLVGADGQKMGKSAGNFINLQDLPEIKFEAVMKWPDELMILGLELLTRVPMSTIEELRLALTAGEIHPMELKQALAYRIVAELDGTTEAEFAEQEFDLVVRKKQQPRRMAEVKIETATSLIEALVAAGLASNLIEAQKLLTTGTIFVNGENIKKRNHQITESGTVIQVGKNNIRRTKKVVF